MAEKLEFDVVVLGGGPGGYTAAFRAADLGLSVCLVEQHRALGGVCLQVGCIPSKTLLHCAEVAEKAEEAAEYGIDFPPFELDLNTLRNKKEQIVKQLAEGLDRLCKARKIRRVTGRGVFQDESTLQVEGEKEDIEISFRDAIIATGSRPATLPESPEDARIWDSTAALALPFVPQRLLIVGGGIIGLEMAQIFRFLGSKITIVEMQDQLLPPADVDLVQPLARKFKDRYRILTGSRLNRIEPRDNGLRVSFGGQEKEEKEEFEAVLVAIGRRPNAEDLGLENLGLSLDDQGCIPVDERLRTEIPHIYAIGDVTGEPMLAHRASHQGKVAAEVIAGQKSAFTPMAIPAVVYTYPEIAWMGITEKEAKEQGLEVLKGKFPWGASGRALSSGSALGVSKALFDKATGRIIGAGICGSNAGELIHEAVLAMEMGADAEDIARTVHAHPTLSETFALAAEVVDGSITDIMPPGKKKEDKS
ncbi:MAG: dihydrolipoyl dehydrogenase [Syntrophotaleaceae bacterium]